MATKSSRTSPRSNKDTDISPPKKSKVEKSAPKSAKSEKKNENKCKKLIMDNLILILTLVAVCIGIGLGIILRNYELSETTIRLLNFPGEIFMNMLKMMIVPLITTSLITGLARLGGKSSRKMMCIAFSYYMTTTVIAVITGIVLVLLIQPGDPRLIQKSNETAVAKPASRMEDNKITTTDTLMDVVRNIFPANIAQAFLQSARTVYTPKPIQDKNDTNSTVIEYTRSVGYADGTNFMGIIAFCIAIGICLSEMGQKSKVVVDFLSILGECVNRLISLIMWFSPIGIISLLVGKIIEAPELVSLVTKLGWYIITIVGGISFHLFITLHLMYFVFARRNPFKFFKAMLPANLAALATSSSAATLPITLMCTEEKLGIQKAVTRFVLPVGATINMDGTALYEAVAAIFIAQLHNIQLSMGEVIIVSVTATLASIGAAAVPSAGLVTMIMVLQSVGLPVEDISLILSVDWMLDRYRTVANITGDAIGAAIVDRYVKVEEDEEQDKSTESPVPEIKGDQSV